MPKIKDLPKHLRPREKLMEKGVENLKDKELLAILMRTGRAGKSALDLASEILKKFPSKKLLSLSFDDLVKNKGISSGKACTLLAAFELSRRATDNFDNSLPIIDSPQKAVDQLTDIRNKSKEYFVALYLNARNQMVHKETISVGTLTASLVHPREVFKPAIKYSAVSIIIAHNHPSGESTPSEDDLDITKRIVEAGRILGIEVMNHVIISKFNSFSFKENKLI